MIVSKSTYILYRECPKNAWVKLHKPEIYASFPPTEFESLIMQGGNEVEAVALELFPNGLLIESRDALGQAATLAAIERKEPVIYQAVFKHDGFLAAADVLRYDPEKQCYDLYEIKAKNSVDEKKHYHDAAFQYLLLKKCGIPVGKAHIVHLNKDYRRAKELHVPSLMKFEDVTDTAINLLEEVAIEREQAKVYLQQPEIPPGPCPCIYKSRSAHCTTFSFINRHVPLYGVHDIARISTKKLTELIDGNILEIENLPELMEFTPIQKKQIKAHKTGQIIIDRDAIKKELDDLRFPLYFIDYETYNPALPRFDGYGTYQHIPFQYALCVIDAPDATPRYYEFLHTDYSDPGEAFIASLQKHIGDEGSIIVWYESFEIGKNKDLATRHPDMSEFMESLNNRIYDLRDIFKKQFYVDKGFLGKTSIKNVLPVLVPELSYKDLAIQNGGSASEQWNRLMVGELSDEEKRTIVKNLKDYCGLDAYAMYAIWKKLIKILN